MTQEKAHEIMKSGKNVFLTGIAGAGKTFVLSQFIEYLKEQETPFAVTASTGIVATAINGVTIHSFSSLGIRDTLNKNDIERIKFNKKITERIRPIDVLIIDEISMLSGQQLDCINAIFKAVRNSPISFGGVQVIFCGDFLQLPPVRGDFAFQSMVWQKMNPTVCYLDKAYRQKEEALLNVLNAIRAGQVTSQTKALVDKQRNVKLKDFTVLFTHNEDVDEFNKNELQKINKKSFFYQMSESGDTELCKNIKRNCLSPELLELRVGAKIMITKNNFEEGFVNGTLGIVKSLENDSVDILTFDNKLIHLTKAKWSLVNRFGKPIASIYQIPLRLAYAITIHKSQGMTLDAAVMNLSKVFTPGQGYVALSRLRSLSMLSLEDFVNDEAYKVSDVCLEYERELIRQSNLL